jgi:predicted HAD superfamily hydrolase
MLETIFISERFFSSEELVTFHTEHGYNINEIYYSSSGGEIDMSVKDEKEFLLKHGTPKILARFGY